MKARVCEPSFCSDCKVLGTWSRDGPVLNSTLELCAKSVVLNTVLTDDELTVAEELLSFNS